VVLEQVRQVAVVVLEDVLRVLGLEDKPRLNFHELLADGLVCLGKDREPFLIADESAR